MDARAVSFPESVRVWSRIALHSFGGPAGQIGYMHKVLVEEKRWISEKRFLHALNYCMILPGPEAMQLITYVGWLMHGTLGGVVAGALFVLPGFLSILGLSVAYALWQDTGVVTALFFGLKAAVLAVVVEAVIRVGKRALRNAALVAIAASAFVAIFVFQVPFPLVIFGAGVIGFSLGRRHPRLLEHGTTNPTIVATDGPVISDEALPHERPSRTRSLRVLATWLALWWLPVIALLLVVGIGHVFAQQAWFFSQAAVVTFGGAYAVLAYVAQRAVEDFAWLRPGEMLDGLGMAETTPGPLIQVVQFVGFMGAYRNPGMLDPLVAGTLAAIIVTWVTFIPCFLWIFLGAPYIEALRAKKGLTHILSGITAAVVGVILNLALWFALHVLFPDIQEQVYGPIRVLMPSTWPDWAALAIAAGSFFALLRLKWPMLAVLAVATLVGMLVRWSSLA